MNSRPELESSKDEHWGKNESEVIIYRQKPGNHRNFIPRYYRNSELRFNDLQWLYDNEILTLSWLIFGALNE